MAVIQFANGVKVNFNGNPTEKDIEEIAQKLAQEGKLSYQSAGVRDADNTDLLAKAAKVTSAIFGGRQIGEFLGAKLAPVFTRDEDEKFLDRSTPSAGRLAGDVVATGLSVAGVKGAGTVGSLGMRILKTAGLGAGIGAGQMASEGGGLGDMAKGAALGGTVGAALPIAGATLRAVGRQIELLPPRFVNSALSRSKQQVLQDIAKDKTDDFAKYVIASKPVGTANKLVLESAEQLKVYNKKIKSALSNSVRKSGQKVTIGRDNFLDKVASIPEAEGALLGRNEIRATVERLAPQTKQLLQKPSLTLEEANRLRQLVDQTLGDRAFLGGQLSADKQILKAFANNLRNTVKDKAPEGTRELFSEYANEIRFNQGLLDRIAKKQGNQVLSFGDFIGGGLGGIFGGGLPGAVAGVATRRVIESVPFKLSAAKLTDAVTKAGPILEQLTPAQQTGILQLFTEIFAAEGKTDNTSNPQSSVTATTREDDGFPFPDYPSSVAGQKLRADLTLSNPTDNPEGAQIVWHLISPSGEETAVEQSEEMLGAGEDNYYYGLEVDIPETAEPGEWMMYVTVNGVEVPGTRKPHPITKGKPVNRYQRN